MSTTAREPCGVLSALETYEHYIIGSPHPVYVYTDHNPLMYLWGRRGKLQIPVSNFSIPELENYLDQKKKLSFSRHPKP